MVPAFNDIKCNWVSLVEQDRRGFILISVFFHSKGIDLAGL